MSLMPQLRYLTKKYRLFSVHCERITTDVSSKFGNKQQVHHLFCDSVIRIELKTFLKDEMKMEFYWVFPIILLKRNKIRLPCTTIVIIMAQQ